RFWHAGGERSRHQEVAHTTALAQDAAASTERQRVFGRSRTLCHRTPWQPLRLLRHKTAAAYAPLDEAFRMQLAVRRLHRIPRNIQRLGQCARRGQWPAHVEHTVEDQFPDGPLDTRMQ